MSQPQKIFSHSFLTVPEAAAQLGVQVALGLSGKEVKSRLEQYGHNELKTHVASWLTVLWRQFSSPFIYLLIGAAVLAILLKEYADGILILLFLVINTTLGFYQEFKSEKTLELLQQYVMTYAKVRRGGQDELIRSSDLVPGDLLVLETGDKIPADVRFVEINSLVIDESVLTGESVPVLKQTEAVDSPVTEIHKAINVGFSGTSIVGGKATALVVATGRQAVIGQISKLASETKRVSNFEKGITHFSNFILKLISVTLVFVFLMNLFIKGAEANFVELIIFSIALAVSVIPEALPTVTTFSLSRGAIHLAKHKVVVRRLSAIEDLGGVEVLCTDKTGTLTENTLTVTDINTSDRRKFLQLINIATTAPQKKKLEPFDIALWQALPAVDQPEVQATARLFDVPFDPQRRCNGVLTDIRDGRYWLLRGAPEAILPLCRLSEIDLAGQEAWLHTRGANGERVLALARKSVSADTPIGQHSPVWEREMELVGMVAFTDPIKPTTTIAVKQAKELGVAIKIITGDAPTVAGSVAQQIGLIAERNKVLTGTQLDTLPVDKQLEAVKKYSVFARVSPEQKYRIIKLLQDEYEVGFLGEGINDAPALKLAGVSLVVQSAADIARESADIVLLGKNLKIIVDGIKEGRKIFANTTKYIKATLASNFGNFYAVAIASLFIPFLPMLPLQILLLNLLSDFPMIAIAADSVDKSELTNPQSYQVKDIVLIATMLGVISSVFDFIFFALFYKISPGVLQTNWFIASVLTEIVFLFSIRSKKFFLKATAPAGVLVWLTCIAVIVTVALPFTTWGQELFHFVTPQPVHLAIVVSLVALYFVITESVKLFYYRERKQG